MTRERGYFIAIEGGDGSGKATQTSLTQASLEEDGYDVMRLSFPRYEKLSSRYVARYLNGEYGPANAVHADLASLPYALDRFAAKPSIEAHLAKGALAVALTDRYDGSNKGHQGTKFADAEQRQRFYKEIDELEYGLFDIPKPDLNIVLLVPPHISHENVGKKDVRSYTERSHDVHEADVNHLELAKANYEELCRLYPDRYTAIDCMEPDGGSMRSREEIQTLIWEKVLQVLRHERSA